VLRCELLPLSLYPPSFDHLSTNRVADSFPLLLLGSFFSLIPILIATAKQTNQITPQLLNAVFVKLVDVLTSEPDASALAVSLLSSSDPSSQRVAAFF